MARASLAFPLEGVSRCVNDAKWEQAEDVLPTLRQYAMKSPIAELDLQAEHAELTATFLLGIQERRRLLRARVVETAKALTRSKPWEAVLQSHAMLLQAPGQAATPPTQPEAPGLEAALSDGCSGLAAITTLQQEEPRSTAQVGTVDEALASKFVPAETHADTSPMLQPLTANQQEVVNPYDEELSPANQPEAVKPYIDELPAGLAMELSSASVTKQLHAAVLAVLAIDSHTSFENWSISAFAQLRKAVLHSAQLAADEMIEVLDGQAMHAVAVVTYLLDVERGSPIRSQQVCEVITILLQCPSWQLAVRSSPALAERIAQPDTPQQLQELFKKALQPRSKTMATQAKSFLKRWIFGCGQKSGQGVSSPSSRTRSAPAERLGGA